MLLNLLLLLQNKQTIELLACKGVCNNKSADYHCQWWLGRGAQGALRKCFSRCSFLLEPHRPGKQVSVTELAVLQRKSDYNSSQELHSTHKNFLGAALLLLPPNLPARSPICVRN